MNYPLSPAQKTFLSSVGEDVNFRGDDNDFGCLMGQIALRLFIEGNIAKAWEAYQNDPGACFGVTFAAWESSMKSLVIRHLENERAKESHAAAMERWS